MSYDYSYDLQVKKLPLLLLLLLLYWEILGLVTLCYWQRPKRWTEQNWPQVYKPALEMLTILLQSKQHLFLDDIITFMGIHEEHIIACIMNIRYSLDKWPLDLAVTALTLIQELSQFKYAWRLTHEKSMFNIMVGSILLYELWRTLLLQN